MLDPIKCFRLNNIRLYSSTFRTVAGIGDLLIRKESALQTRRHVKHQFVDRVSEDDVATFLLISIDLGMRLIAEDDDPDDKADQIYLIEAGFVAEFEVMCGDFDDDSLAEFVSRNGPHVVWPFWRQHVCTTLQTASLPVLQMPLLPPVKRPPPGQPATSSSAKPKKKPGQPPTSRKKLK